MKYTVYAEAQGLYAVQLNGRVIGKISNKESSGKWYAYLVTDRRQTSPDIRVNPHNPTQIEAAFDELLAARA